MQEMTASLITILCLVSCYRFALFMAAEQHFISDLVYWCYWALFCLVDDIPYIIFLPDRYDLFRSMVWNMTIPTACLMVKKYKEGR